MCDLERILCEKNVKTARERASKLQEMSSNSVLYQTSAVQWPEVFVGASLPAYGTDGCLEKHHSGEVMPLVVGCPFLMATPVVVACLASVGGRGLHVWLGHVGSGHE